MISSIGVIIDCALSDLDIHTPKGMPIARHKIVAAEIIVTVEIIGSHILRNPIAKNASITPIETLILLEPSQARTPATAKKTGQGVANNNFSMIIRKDNNGSKNDSILFPNCLVKSLNAKSTHLRELIITSPGIDITLLKNKLKSEVLIESLTLVDNELKCSVWEAGSTERIDTILDSILLTKPAIVSAKASGSVERMD